MRRVGRECAFTPLLSMFHLSSALSGHFESPQHVYFSVRVDRLSPYFYVARFAPPLVPSS